MNISFEKKQEISISVFDVVGNMISSKNYFEKNIYDNLDFSNLSAVFIMFLLIIVKG